MPRSRGVWSRLNWYLVVCLGFWAHSVSMFVVESCSHTVVSDRHCHVHTPFHISDVRHLALLFHSTRFNEYAARFIVQAKCPSYTRHQPKLDTGRRNVLDLSLPQAFTTTMQSALTSEHVALDFYTAPGSVPYGLNGTEDCAVSAAHCLAELKPELSRWDAVSRRLTTGVISPIIVCRRVLLGSSPRPHPSRSLLVPCGIDIGGSDTAGIEFGGTGRDHHHITTMGISVGARCRGGRSV